MARSEARLKFNIWAGLDGLSPHARLVYAVLLTEPTANHAGVGAIRLGKWARNAGLTVEEVGKALEELGAHPHVVLDEDTDEFLIRTMIRNDGVLDQPYVLKGAIREALATESPRLRRVLAGELRKLPPRRPDGLSKVGKLVTYPDPHAAADVLDPPPDPHPTEPSRNPSETLFETPEKPFQNPSTKKPFPKGVEREHGGGRGRGSSSATAQPGSTTTNGEKSPSANGVGDPDLNRTAQALAKTYCDREPLSKFPAVMQVAKRALTAGYDTQRVQDALLRMADDKRAVTVDAMRVELEGPPRTRAAPDRVATTTARVAAIEALRHPPGSDT